MATKTPNLGLIKPAKSEFENNWDLPVNKNFDLLDGFVSETQAELQDARGTKATLAERLDVTLNSDGTIRDFPEVRLARNSAVYGNSDAAAEYTLGIRIQKGEREILDARQGQESLTASLAVNADDFVVDSVISAPPGFLSFTGPVAKIDGTLLPVVFNVNGFRREVRKLVSLTISGAAGTYYLYAEKNAAGDKYLDRTTAGLNNGVCAIYSVTQKLSQFSDSSQNFITSGVAPGDILEITSAASANKGQYVVESVVSATALTVRGIFSAAQSNLAYSLTNPKAPSFGFTATAHGKRYGKAPRSVADAGRAYFGRVDFDGTNIISTTTYALKGRFEQVIAVSAEGSIWSQEVSHNLGYLPSKVSLFATQAADLSQALEPISVGTVAHQNTTEEALPISVFPTQSLRMKLTDKTIALKTPTAGLFYKSFDDVTYSSGYLLISVER